MERALFLRGNASEGGGVALGRDNLILRANARFHSVKDYPGPLSIKTVTKGLATWRHDGRNLPLRQESFLVLTDGHPYSRTIEARVPVHTCCVFFARGFVESVHSSMTQIDLEPDSFVQLDFLSHVHPRDGRMLHRIGQIAARVNPDAMWIEEQFVSLAHDLLHLYDEVRKRISHLPGRKAGTREELYRRVSRGRDFIHAHAFSRISLKEVAQASFLSPYHFHRAFRRAFGISPHEYVTRLRIDRATQLLLTVRELSIMNVAENVGFESATSFANLFRRHKGISPSAIRGIQR